MKHIDSLTRLRLKTVGGYVSLMALFIIASVIVVFKSGNLEENSKRYRENIDRRALSEGAFLQLFDLTQLGGQAASFMRIPDTHWPFADLYRQIECQVSNLRFSNFLDFIFLGNPLGAFNEDEY